MPFKAFGNVLKDIQQVNTYSRKSSKFGVKNVIVVLEP
jgi:hypothetical protein